jgi:hypothetical protein
LVILDRRRLREEKVVVANVGDADHEYLHSSACPVNDARGDLYDRALADRVLHAVEQDAALAIQHIVQLGGALVVMEPGAVNVHGMDPGSDVLVLSADKEMAPAAGAAFTRRLALVADQGGAVRVIGMKAPRSR